ncbi:hypothetical protein HK102_010922, partial [Quaeritorhiza haematococci]
NPEIALQRGATSVTDLQTIAALAFTGTLDNTSTKIVVRTKFERKKGMEDEDEVFGYNNGSDKGFVDRTGNA